jgi:hypothetical protein
MTNEATAKRGHPIIESKPGQGKDWKELSGSHSEGWTHHLVSQLLNISGAPGEDGNRAAGANLSVMMGINPRDEMEGMLAAMMIAAQNAAMTCFKLAVQREGNSAARMLELSQANKLMRSFVLANEALARHRENQTRTSPPTPNIGTVHVSEGGQAIFGNVSHTGGQPTNGAKQPHGQPSTGPELAQITNAPFETLPGDFEANEEALPGSGSSGL